MTGSGLADLPESRKLWLLHRIEYFIAEYEAGNKKPDTVAYEIFRGFTTMGVVPGYLTKQQDLKIKKKIKLLERLEELDKK